MSYDLVKSITCSKESGKITINCASNNVMPRNYRPYTLIDGVDEGEYLETLEGIAHDLYSGNYNFLAGCRSHAHEAHLKAMDKVAEEYPGYGLWFSEKSCEMEDLYVSEFMRLMDEPRDKQKYYLTLNGRRAELRPITESCHVIGYRGYNTSEAKPVDYIKMKVMTDSLSELGVGAEAA